MTVKMMNGCANIAIKPFKRNMQRQFMKSRVHQIDQKLNIWGAAEVAEDYVIVADDPVIIHQTVMLQNILTVIICKNLTRLFLPPPNR